MNNTDNNLYAFESRSNVRITTKDNKTFFGTVLHILDQFDIDDLEKREVSIQTYSGNISINEGDIQYIEIVDSASLNSILFRIEKRLSLIFRQSTVKGKVCFLLPSGHVSHLYCVFGKNQNFICAEYADSISDAKKDHFHKRGEFWYVEDLSDDELFKSLIKEMGEK